MVRGDVEDAARSECLAIPRPDMAGALPRCWRLRLLLRMWREAEAGHAVRRIAPPARPRLGMGRDMDHGVDSDAFSAAFIACSRAADAVREPVPLPRPRPPRALPAVAVALSRLSFVTALALFPLF